VTPVEQRLEELERICEAIEREPTGFIFHMSRCGSTLISRMLAAVERALVISEPEAVNDLLLPGPTKPVIDQKRWLRGVIRAFDKRPRGGAEWFFVKFSSWNVIEHRRIRAAFPRTPSLFVFREPVEVMVSALREPTGWLRWRTEPTLGPYLTGLQPEELGQLTDEEYCARVIARFCSCALVAGESLMSLHPLEYVSLPHAVWTDLPRVFGMKLSGSEVEAMRAVSLTPAKDFTSQRAFQPDSQDKHQHASAAVLQAALRFAAVPVGQLRALCDKA
jgi:hypothetical protein